MMDKQTSSHTGSVEGRGVRVVVALSLALLLAAAGVFFFVMGGASAQSGQFGGVIPPSGDATRLAEGAEPSPPASPSVVDESECPLAETGLQGQVPKEDQLSGRSKEGYRCGLEKVGQNDIQNRGANSQLAWLVDYAYVGSFDAEDRPPEGIAVVDAGDPRNPELVRIMETPGGVNQWEGLEAHEGRKMLVGYVGPSSGRASGVDSQAIYIYDAEDPSNPQIVGTFNKPGTVGFHGLKISPDGNTIYATNTSPRAEGEEIYAIDVSDMSNPQLIEAFGPTEDEAGETLVAGFHDAGINPEGTRLYVGTAFRNGNEDPAMLILDVSEVQERQANPEIKFVSDIVYAPDSPAPIGHTLRWVKIGGKEHVLLGGETGRCPWAHNRIIDISDEENPVQVSQFLLEVQDTANCEEVAQDDLDSGETTRATGFMYSSHYNGVDDENDAKVMFYTEYGSGLRAIDIRDPANPKEIAYYNPPPRITSPFVSGFASVSGLWDASVSDVRYRPETGEIWFVSVQNGFQIVEFEEGVMEPQPQPQPAPQPAPQPRPNAAPDARNDSFTTREDRTLTVRRPGVLRNDRDVNGDRLSARVVNRPRHGRLTLRADGSFVYRPDRNYNGRDSFVYSVSDAKGGTDRAKVTLRVRPVPEPNRPSGGGGTSTSTSSQSSSQSSSNGGNSGIAR